MLLAAAAPAEWPGASVFRFPSSREKCGPPICGGPHLRYKNLTPYRRSGIPAFKRRSRTVEIGTDFVKKIPNPIDRHVGSRVRMRRVMLGMSQEKLGDALGLTFQQVQKYEKGTNRIGASRLQQISRTLDVPPAFFFEGAPSFEAIANPPAAHLGFSEEPPATYVADFLSTPEALHLNLAFARIHDPKVRKRIVDLVSSLAGEDERPAPLASGTPDSGEKPAE
jgi:transcriptional regulator with XRE-family HTH domain